MSTFTFKGKKFRYYDQHIPGDKFHCYNPKCQDLGKDLIDYLARWENVHKVDSAPADSVLFSCVDHLGPGFEEAKELFSFTQKTKTAAYLTKDQVENSRR